MGQGYSGDRRCDHVSPEWASQALGFVFVTDTSSHNPAPLRAERPDKDVIQDELLLVCCCSCHV